MLDNVTISEHCCIRYIERFAPNLNAIRDYGARLTAAKRGVKIILNDARYVSDNSDGILLHSETFRAKIVIRNKVILTIIPFDIKTREKKKWKSK